MTNDAELLRRIAIDPRIMVGKPVIRGTRLTVGYVLKRLATGSTIRDLLDEYEGLTADDVDACLLFAAQSFADIGQQSAEHDRAEVKTPRRPEIVAERSDFERLVAPLVGLPVNWPWRGYGSAISLELGALRREPRMRGGHSLKGQVTIMIEWDWRVENPRWIEFGSSSYDKELNTGLKTLQRRRIEAIAFNGRVPEITIAFDDDRRLRTFMTNSGRPMWCIFLPDGSYIHIDEKTSDIVMKREL